MGGIAGFVCWQLERVLIYKAAAVCLTSYVELSRIDNLKAA